MLDWDDLVPSALLGTDRSRPDLLTDADRLGGLIQALPQSDPADVLLSTAGSLAIHQLIGTREPTPTIELVDGIAPEPTRPLAPAPVISLLQRLIEERDVVVLSELLKKLEKRDWRLPERLLPYLLGLGEKNGYVRPIIINVLDPRGRWLAKYNPAWEYARLPEYDTEAIHKLWRDGSGTLIKKRYLLTWYRQTDPVAAREMLALTWRSQVETSRQNLLDCLKVNLSLEDELFLEQSLDDRQLAVRKKGQELLSRLPDSQYSRRLTQYADRMLRWFPERDVTLQFDMPSRYSHQLGRDGIMFRNERKRADLVSKRITRLASGIPLDYWTSEVSDDIDQFLYLIAKSGRSRTFVTALAQASSFQRRNEWLLTLIPFSQYTKSTIKYIGQLNDQELVSLIKQMGEEPFRKEPLSRTNPYYDVLTSWKRPWPAPVARELLEVVEGYVRSLSSKKSADASTISLIGRFVGFVPPEMKNELKTLQELAESKDYQALAAVMNGLRMLDKRAEIHAVLGE